MNTIEALDYMGESAKKKGASHFDILAGESESLSLDLFEKKIKNTELSSSRGIGIRLFVDGKPGYAFTEKFSPEAIDQCVTDAIGHTELTGSLEVELPKPEELPKIDLGLWSDNIKDIEAGQLKELGLQLESAAFEANTLVENIPYLSMSKSSGKSWIRNSLGLDYSVRANSVGAGLGVVAVKGESRKMGVYFNNGTALSELEPKYMAQTAVQRAVELLGAKPIQSGKYPVVLSHRVSGQIISMYSAPYYAEVVQKNQSKLEGKQGASIASPLFNLTCEPHLKGFSGSQLFDGEGILSQTTKVVEAGVLNTYLYNLEAAKKENRSSTGHASRGYSGQVGTSFSNMMVAKGKESLDDLLSQHSKCFYVTNLEGGSGCSAISGELSIGAQGFWVENGKKVQPVEGVTISSNYFELLNDIQGLSDTYSDIHSSVKVPDILLRTMFVAG